MKAPNFKEAKESGEIVDKRSYHKPHISNCGCDKTTRKGAYRDTTVSLESMNVHFYHQSPVVVKQGDYYRIDSCGYQTTSTKERINRYLPYGYKVIQRDFKWYLETPEDRLEFKDGMIIKAE